MVVEFSLGKKKYENCKNIRKLYGIITRINVNNITKDDVLIKDQVFLEMNDVKKKTSKGHVVCKTEE